MIANENMFVAGCPLKTRAARVTGDYVTLLGESFYRIQNYDAIPPFFISLASSSDHWLFISTTGGLTAGRKNADHALFPYYTEDRITENYDNTGSKTLLIVDDGEHAQLWEPFSDRHRGLYRIERNLYKNIAGTALVFEEANHDLGLIFRYAWRTSEAFGFVKTSWLVNQRSTRCTVSVLDGLQNILPAFVTAQTQNEFSVLLNAYKRSELDPETGLGLFSLSSRLTDLAEPSESLRANTVWQVGLGRVSHLLSDAQLTAFRSGAAIQPESDLRGQRGAYYVHKTIDIGPGETRSWHIVAEVDQDNTSIASLIRLLVNHSETLYDEVETDIAANTHRLTAIVASADGLQKSNDTLSAAHHFANVMFNVMRGGIFADQYQVDTADFRQYVAIHHPALLENRAEFFAALPPTMTIDALKARAETADSADLVRLCSSYLPLTFSRRHGDPSRPWNRFEINLRQADGSQQLDYQGNWRDIFQNWEALAYAYPEFLEGMIAAFLNATTVDGYNPYRITRHGVDWEVPEPSNPWANIGYWSDHQIIYLQKLLEAYAGFYPGQLERQLTRAIYAYANVPYRIKPYAEMLENPRKTIDFDWDQHRQIEALIEDYGADGRLVRDAVGNVRHTSLAEKLLSLLLAKLVNFVPEGGIWMNTQRPEWNDANNALVGKGISVVTLGYLRRYVAFVKHLLLESGVDTLTLSLEIASLLDAIRQILSDHRDHLLGDISDDQRRTVLDELGQAGSVFRARYYRDGLSGQPTLISVSDVVAFLELAQAIIEHSLRLNQRPDGLYHAYNVLHITEDRAVIKRLDLMLEGQVSILSSGLLEPAEALHLLRRMRQSRLYRADQHSYLLYPDRDLPGFLAKNTIDAEDVRGLALVEALLSNQNTSLITRDVNGAYHFSGDVRNAQDVARVLAALAQQPRYADRVAAEAHAILALFERVFNHDAFTGRSGSFFGYEGLGSVYWHMVSKLLLAIQETVFAADRTNDSSLPALIEMYFDVRAGLGFNKTPDAYGAFPTDPYSHTPGGQGARQPGMTGTVKEEILTRLGELGLVIDQGQITINPVLLRSGEFLSAPSTLRYFDVAGEETQVDVPAGSLAFTLCQVPIILRAADKACIDVMLHDGSVQSITGHNLGVALSRHVFSRDGMVRRITVFLADGSGANRRET